MEGRPDPKEVLEYIKKEELALSRGKLKVFLGASPGVGKTYSMLQEAITKQQEGMSVLAGIVESHGRKDTDFLLKKVEKLPLKTISYKEKIFHEFDLDAVLNMRPDLVLVDEMAHTNVPGSRHEKRWQDIEEILERGIDVFTTLNVQHIESLNNIVEKITGIAVRETVPDVMLEKAHAIELIDLPPDDLLKRLEEGKVYVPSEVGPAVENFFKKGNLIALRELALRETAKRVNIEVQLHRKGEAIRKIWPTTEKLMVCIGPDPNGANLIRSAARMAKSLNVEWIALSIATPEMNLEEHDRIIQHLRLAEKMGAETMSMLGVQVAKEIINFARNQNITKIIIGKRVRSRWQDPFGRSLSDQIIRNSEDIDLFVLRNAGKDLKRINLFSNYIKSPKSSYLICFLTIMACTIANLFFFDGLELSTLIMVYLLGVTYVSSKGQIGPSILASLLSVISFGFFFLPTRFSYSIEGIQHIITLLAMLLVSQLIASLTSLTRQQSETSQIREQRISTMHHLTKQLASHRGCSKLLTIAVKHIATVFDSDVIALMPNDRKELVIASGNPLRAISSKEQSVAKWVYDMKQVAGLGTQTLPDNEAIYVPMIGKKGSVGVLRVLPQDKHQFLMPDQLHLLEGFANQAAMALEVDRLQEEASRTGLQIETDRMRNMILKYFSDNMRLPLNDIMKSAHALADIGYQLSFGAIQKLADSIYNNTDELNHLINKLTQIIHLESTDSITTKKLHSIKKLIYSILKTLTRNLKDREVTVIFPEPAPKIHFNKVFLEKVFVNIIENALKYTPPQSPLIITVTNEDTYVLISIEDRGPGLALEEINKIFDKFYRGQAIADIKGMGLGLAICQRIIKLHGGEIWAENAKEGGAIFKFTLPF